MALIDSVIAAYGGTERWLSMKSIVVTFSANGLAFTLKHRPIFNHATLHLEVDHPVCSIRPIGHPRKNVLGKLIDEDVHLMNESQLILAQRKRIRRFFPYGRRLLWWDDLDMTYFACYAMWNYLTLPRLLMDEAACFTELNATTLVAEFNGDFPTHSRKQVFQFDPSTFLLKQHNYAVDIISPLATASNVIKSHALFEGIPVANHRVVTPMRRDGTARKAPVLIDLQIHTCHFLE